MATLLESHHATPNIEIAAERYLTPQQFCEIYHIAPRTAERWRVTGDGPKWVRLGLRKVAYRLSDCEAWAAARTFEHRADELTRGPARVGATTV